MTPTQSALVALVPDAEPVVEPHRRRLDSGRAMGVPAHVTLLYPFLEPGALDDDVLAELARVVGTHPAIDVEFAVVAWFGDDVAYLEPAPDDAFRRLTGDLWERWPECPPYAGEIAEPTPHLTIGDRGRSSALEAAVAEIAPALPIAARIESVHLLVGSDQPGSWSSHHEFPLAT